MLPLASLALSGLLHGCTASPRGPVTVWAAGPRREISPAAKSPAGSDPIYDAQKGTLSLRSAINETVSFQLVVRAGPAAVNGIDVSLTPLLSSSQQHLPADVKLYRAYPIEVRAFRPWQSLYRADDCQPRQVYDILLPADAARVGLPADLPADSLLLIWADIRVQKGGEPGTYAGSLRVTARGQPLWTINVVLQVDAFALPDAPALFALSRFDARELCRAHLRLQGRPYAPTRLTADAPLAQQALDLAHAAARLLDEHGIAGVPTGYEPPLHVDGEGRLSASWEDYDQLIQPLIDGSQRQGKVRPAFWPLPLDADHPALPRDGRESLAAYQDLLRQATAMAAEYFRLRRWHEQTFVEITPPGTWPDDYVQWQQVILPAVRRGAPDVRELLRLPPADLGGYGWPDWPSVGALLDAAGILSVPGRFFIWQVQAEASNRQLWLRPDTPPFSPSLALGAGAIDPAAVAWAAWRLRAGALDLPDQGGWPDRRDVIVDHPDTPTDSWLFWPGSPWGLDAPVPSVRLKRLGLGLQECKYLYLLRQHGRVHVDELLAESLVPLAGSLAYGRQYAEGLTGELALEEGPWDAALELLAEELQMAMAGIGSDEFATFTNRIDWQSFLRRTRQVRAWADPARLYAAADGSIRVQVPVEVLNLRAEPLRGRLRWAQLPEPWRGLADNIQFGPLEPFQRTRILLTAEGPAIGTDDAGHAELAVMLECEPDRPVEVRSPLSAVAAARLKDPIRVDGDLSDWTAGRFNLIAAFGPLGLRREPAPRPDPRRSEAFVGTDGRMLYVAVRMQDDARQMRISQTNAVRYDGSLPAGEDLIEILIDPDNGAGGGPQQLLHVVVKANGAAVATAGVDTWPPVCRPQPLGARILAATKIHQDAWTAEVAIPLEAIKPVRPDPAYWGFNICRLRAADLQYTSWSRAKASSYHPSCLGNLLVPSQSHLR